MCLFCFRLEELTEAPVRGGRPSAYDAAAALKQATSSTLDVGALLATSPGRLDPAIEAELKRRELAHLSDAASSADAATAAELLLTLLDVLLDDLLSVRSPSNLPFRVCDAWRDLLLEE